MRSTADDTLRSEHYTFTCECGTQFDGAVYHRINVTLEPKLLYTLLAGRLNVATCPNCGRIFASPLPFLYHDLKRGLFAYVHPGAEPETPPMQVIFGLDRLVHLVESLLEPGERLGQVALATRSQAQAERDRLLSIGRQFADKLPLCQVDASDAGGVFTVRVYGPRAQVGQLVHLLAQSS